MNEPVGGTGRFAPSPTGPLHFGSLLAAVASYLDARASGARWLVRIEDIDPPREAPGASDEIIRALEAYGFEWDGDIIWQSQSAAAHDQALEVLAELGLTYPCGCSRRDLADAPRSTLGTIYPGTCRDGTSAAETAIRVRTISEPTAFEDLYQGRQTHRLETESGDFVVKRRDGLVAYQLAVVVDDCLQGVTRIVRGIDLIDSTFRQVWLQQCLGYPTPVYGHIPVAVHANGDKLSKLTGAPGISTEAAVPTLIDAFTALGQRPGPELSQASLQELWRWATDHWDPAPLVGKTQISPDFDRI